MAARGWRVATAAAKYRNTDELEIECPAGHAATKKYYSLMTGKGCKSCGAGRGERMTRMVLEQMFGLKFKLSKPKWLHDPRTNGRLELDMFCPELRLAIKYHGEQHFNADDFRHRNRDRFDKLRERDAWKREKCREHGINLIEIRYFAEDVLYDSVAVIALVEKALADAGVPVPSWERANCDPVAAK